MPISKHNLPASSAAAMPTAAPVLTPAQRVSVLGRLEEIREMVGKAESPDELAVAAYGATDLARVLNCCHHEALANAAGVVNGHCPEKKTFTRIARIDTNER